MAISTDDYLWKSVSEASESVSTANSRLNNNQNLDKNAFLNLLVTQMKYQDPLNPTDDKQFMAQMAQFSSLEQMQNLTKSANQQQGYALIGKTIAASVYNDSKGIYEQVNGLVQSVLIKKGETFLKVGDKEVPIDRVSDVFDFSSSNLSNINANIATNQTLSMVGKYVQAFIIGDNNKVTAFVEGKVDYIKFDSDGKPILMVGENEVYPGEVSAVADSNMLLGKNVNYSGDDGNIEGTISSIKIKDEKAFVEVNGKEIGIDKISYLTDALRMVGSNINHEKLSGKVDSVTLKDGTVYLNVGANSMSFKEYKKN